jgi:hypothetical protein
MIVARIRGAGLAGIMPFARTHQLTSPSYSRKSSGEIALFFQVYLLHPWGYDPNEAASCGCKVLPFETSALERVLRATARYSIRGWRSNSPSTNTSRSTLQILKKALEGQMGRAKRLRWELVHL